MKNKISIINKLLFLSLMGAVLSAFTGVPALLVIGVLLLFSVIVPLEKGAAYELIVADLKADFGAYYLQQGQNLQRLYTLIRQTVVTPSYARPIMTKDTIYRASKAIITEVIQAFQKYWTAKGDAEFTPREFRLYNIKADLSQYPDDIVESWLGFLATKDKMERKEWPIIRYVFEELVIPRANQDLETKAYYYGEYVAPTNNVAGSALNAMNGIRKLLRDGNVNDLTIGNIDKDNIVDAIETIVTDEIPDEFKGVPMMIAMAPKMVMWHQQDYRNTFGGNNNYTEGKAVTVDFAPNYELVPLPSMAGSEDIWITPKINFLHLRPQSGFPTPNVDEYRRQVDIHMNWWEGFAFGLDEMVWFYEKPQSGSGN